MPVYTKRTYDPGDCFPLTHILSRPSQSYMSRTPDQAICLGATCSTALLWLASPFPGSCCATATSLKTIVFSCFLQCPAPRYSWEYLLRLLSWSQFRNGIRYRRTFCGWPWSELMSWYIFSKRCVRIWEWLLGFDSTSRISICKWSMMEWRILVWGHCRALRGGYWKNFWIK